MKQKLKQTEIGLIPKEWDVIKLGEVSDTYAGGTPLRSNKEYYGGNIRWVKSGEVNLGEIFDTEEKITESGLKNSSAKQIPENTVLVAMYGATAGKVGILRVKGTANQAVLAIPNNKGKFNYRFMYYLLSSKTNKLVNSTQGTGQPNLSKFLVDNLEIQLPPINEQTSIAEVLSTVDARLDIVERESQRVERLKVALMKELFDGKKWPLVRMKDVCIINPSKKEISHLDENSEVSFLPMASISEDGIIISKQAKLLKNANKGFTYFREGDVLIAKITPCFENGKRALAKELKHQIGFGTTEFHVLRSGEKVLPEWIFYVISSSRFRKKGEQSMVGSAGQKRVPIKFIEDYEIALPPLSEQRRVADILSTVDKKLSLQQSKKSKLEKIKKSLMNDLLTGKKRVKVT